MNDIIKVVKSLEELCILLKIVSEKIQNEVEEQKDGFSNILLGTLGAVSLRNLLPGKGIKAKIPGREVIRAVKRAFNLGQDF